MIFDKGLGFTVGDGESIHFWFDDWVGVGPSCILFPRVFGVVCNK